MRPAAELRGVGDLLLEIELRRGQMRRALREALRLAIQDGRLGPGARLPASRPLAAELGVSRGVVTDARLQTAAPDVYAAGDVAVFFDLMIGKHNQMGTWDNALAHGKVAAHNMAGGSEDFFDVPTYTTTMFGSTMAVMGVTPDVQPDLESVRTFSFEEGFFRKLFFYDERLVGAIMIGPPKGRKKLIEIMHSRQRIDRPRQELLDPANLT